MKEFISTMLPKPNPVEGIWKDPRSLQPMKTRSEEYPDAEKPTQDEAMTMNTNKPIIMIRNWKFGPKFTRFFTAIGELRDVTDDDDYLEGSQIIDCGEVKTDETAKDAAALKRAKYCYERRY